MQVLFEVRYVRWTKAIVSSHIHTCIHTHVRTHTRALTYTHTHARTHIHAHTLTQACRHAHTCIHAHTHSLTHTCMHTQAHIRAHKHAYTQTHSERGQPITSAELSNNQLSNWWKSQLGTSVMDWGQAPLLASSLTKASVCTKPWLTMI